MSIPSKIIVAADGQPLCKNHSWSANSVYQRSKGMVLGFGKEISTSVPPTEVSWISPLQFDTEYLQKEYNSVDIPFSNVSNVTGIVLKAKSSLEPDPLFTSPFYIFFTIMSCLGNLGIILTICSFSKFRKPANLLIANLSISSLLFIISINLRYMEYEIEGLWTYSTTLCRTLAVLHRFPVPMVALSTMAISFDRGRVARNPLVRTCSWSPVCRVLMIWCFSIIITVPLGFSRKFDRCINNPYKCSKTLLLNSRFLTVGYGLLFLMSVYIIPSLILIHESTKTLRKIRFLRASTATWSCSGQVQLFPSIPDTRLRLLRNSCIFSVIFLLFWLPFGICQFLLDLPSDLLSDVFFAYTKFYLTSMKNISYIQIVANPVILFMLSYDFGKYCQRFTIKCPVLV